jgi:alkylation response protein AidB-like acyl-CoA dehydrogenase
MTTMLLTDDEVRDEVRRFVAEAWDPDLTLAEWWDRLADSGWAVPTWPAEWLGRGLPGAAARTVSEELRAGRVLGPPAGLGLLLAGPTILAHGTDAQKERYLRPIVNGQEAWCQLFSEPGAGSDLASLQTRAVRDGDEWIINGQKVWTSGAQLSDFGEIICRTNPEAEKHKGITAFIVDMRAPGVTIKPLKQMNGGAGFNEVFFDDVRVPAANLVGQEGGSFKQTMRQLEHERGGIDRLLSNHALYLDAKARADTSDPLVRQEIARLETGYQLGRLLVLRETLKQAPPSFSAATKTFCTEHEQCVAAFAARVVGADALIWGRMARGVCYSPAYTIMGGTSNVLRNIIGERVLGLPREPS